MARPKKSVLQTAHTTHGMVENFKPTTIDQVLGNRGGSDYKFLNDPFSEEEYAAHLKNMVNSDLYTHCQDHGLIFTDNRKMIETKLLGIFRESRAKFRMPASATPKTSNNPDYNVVSKIMAGGR